MKRKIDPRHFIRRKDAQGRTVYRWQPTAALRAEGFSGERLPDDLKAAWKRAEELNAAVDRHRLDTSKPVKRLPLPQSLAWAAESYWNSPEFRKLSATTQDDYRKQYRRIEADFGANQPVAAITKAVVYAYRTKLADTPRQANYRLSVLRLILEHAVRLDAITTNPARNFRALPTKPRRHIWSAEQINAFKAVALPSVQLAVDIALYTGQRPADVLGLQWSDVKDGWVTLVQGKTGATVSLPVFSALDQALAATERKSAWILVNERTGRPWQQITFQREVAATIKRAGLADTGLHFQDFRRTSVVALAEAGATVPQIAAVTGHDIDECARIISTYLVPTKPQAEAAIRALEARASLSSGR